MATITIATEDFFSYSDVAAADIYAIPSLNFPTWNGKTDDEKGAFLIQASRFLDSLEWIDDYNTQTLRLAVTDIVAACQEIAILFSTGETDWIGGDVPSDSTKRLKAGTAEIEFMGSPWYATKAIDWPSSIYRLLKDCLLGSQSGDIGANSFGTDATVETSMYDGGYDLVND